MTMPLPSPPVPVLFVHFGDEGIRGSERCLLDLLKHLDRRRFRPFAWCNQPTMAAAIHELGVPVTMSHFSVLLDWGPPRWDLQNYMALVREGIRLVRAYGIRLVHSNSAAPCQWMIPVARYMRIPVVAHLHAIYDLRGRCIFGLHHVSHVIGVSFETIRGLLNDGMQPHRVQVIHNGIDIERLTRGDARGLRQELGIPPDEVVIGAVGSIIPGKGFHVLLDAFQRLRRLRPCTRLLIIGEGPERERLEQDIAKRDLANAAYLLGKRADVGAIFRDACNLAVSASFEEAFGLTVLEAAAMGLPVVATRVGVASAEDGFEGLIVPVGDPESLAHKMLTLVDDPKLRARFGAAGRTLVEAKYSINRNVEEICSVYESLLARCARAYGWVPGIGPVSPWIRFASGVMWRYLTSWRRVTGKLAPSGDAQ